VAKRSYDQLCPVARALDVVGERWAMLVVRELLFGPRRYTDLARGLGGIGPNVLAERLRTLAAADVVRRRTLPPPAPAVVYELTERGEALGPTIESLFDWGLALSGDSGPDLEVSWLIESIRLRLPMAADEGTDEAYELRVGDEVLHVAVEDGRVALHRGAAREPAVVVTTDLATFLAIGRGGVTVEEAVASGRLRAQGTPEAGRRCAAVLMGKDNADLASAAA
jgi:DNA-binding HxlR family transcriptional regulator/putative sterol carrier protein